VPYSLVQLLELAVQHRASLLHLNVGSPPILRINERLRPIGEHRMTRGDCHHLLAPVVSREHRRSLERGQEVDFCYAAAGSGFRFNLYVERGQVGASIRRLRTDIPRLEDLGLSGGVVEEVLSENFGLIVLTGPPRCGKINTLAALLSYLNAHRQARIVSLEQPIQFWHQNLNGTMIQREIGSDTASFARGVQQAVLQDPDVLALTELPDRDTAEFVIRAAAGGHLVIAVLDASSCARAVDRLISTFHDDADSRVSKTLSRALRVVMCQTLVQRADGRGMIPAFEILHNTDEVCQELRSGRVDDLHWIMRTSGMQTLGRALSRLVDAGLVTQDEALQHLDDPAELELRRQVASASESPQSEEDTPLMSWL
jgi:twitching motility protein PilT